MSDTPSVQNPADAPSAPPSRRPRRGTRHDGPRTVIVTGGTRGIGRAVALRLAREGMRVVITGRAESPAALRTLDELRACGVEALYFDVRDREAAERALSGWIGSHGAPWGVVVNAGINRDAPLAGMSGEDWDEVLSTDLGGFYNVMKPVVMPMARAREGRVIVMSSVSGIAGTRGQTNYSAAKAGLIGAAKALSTELASRGITVNVIAPGLVDTEMVTDEDRERILPWIPMRRLGRPEEIAGLAAFLMGDEAGYITRAVIPVCGGLL